MPTKKLKRLHEIKKYLDINNISRDNFAKAIGVHRATVYAWCAEPGNRYHIKMLRPPMRERVFKFFQDDNLFRHRGIKYKPTFEQLFPGLFA